MQDNVFMLPRRQAPAQPGWIVPNNLPAQLTPLIGREAEVADVCALVRRPKVRLVTLTGTGGVGKTRLGLQVAAHLLEDFADGIYFVSLAPLSQPDLVLPTLAQTFGLKETPDWLPLEHLKSYLREKQLLLLLDNFEQVIAVAPLLVALLQACPALKMLVTSRARLRVSGEHEFSVPPLALPDLHHLPEHAALLEYAAVALLLQRAQALKPDLQLTADNARTIAEICLRLDGLPLAIELAAARLKLLSPQALLARLTHRLQVLTGGVQDAPVRQQTLRNTIQWSYDLLTAEEQRLFRRLCVFVAGCTLEAVETVCAALPDGVGQALEGVTSLLDKSLLQQSEHEAGEPRLSMLETLREYGLDCLHQSTEAEAIQGAHANYYLSPPYPKRVMYSFDEVLDKDEGWARFNRHYWLRDYRGFLEFFMSQIFTEPHSTRQIEDCVGWGLETTPEVLIATDAAPSVVSKENVEDFVRRVRCPVLIFHGDEDALVPYTRSTRLAELTGGTLVTIEGGGHYPQGRDPVKFNLLLHDFIKPSPAPTVTWRRAQNRRKRALYISSPIGLGHARRDVAIADELRRLRPDLEIDWLAQHPVTEVLKARGERIHPASAHLANESRHIESESAEHDLHFFQAWRRMDEILVANYMLFHDVVNEELYDLWIGDEAWELDYYLHENPEEKRAAYVWLTDFVGWLPMPDGGTYEAFLTADYNAEMIEHIERFPRLRDRAIFVGNPEDIVPDTFGPNLPAIRSWTEQHYDFAGYITGFDPAAFADREATRTELGYAPDEKVCIVAVGGTGVGEHLLRRVMAAFPEARRRVPALRMIVVPGPRIDPQSLPPMEGIEVRGYVHELNRHLAICDLAVVQGGLTTAMELTAYKRPFLYFPLRHHFEQNFHVRYRLDRYQAGRCMDFAQATPEVIAAAIAEEIGRKVSYRDVEQNGAARAAARIADLI